MTSPAIVREALEASQKRLRSTFLGYGTKGGCCNLCGEGWLNPDTERHTKVCLIATNAAALAALDATPGEGERYRHKVRGTEYELIGTAELQDAKGGGVEEGALLAIYRGADGKLWARRHTEFGDGRFERLPAAPLSGSVVK